MKSISGLLVMTALSLTACASVQPVPNHPNAIATIERYYRYHAWEEGGRCLVPDMTVTDTEVVENTPDRLVLNVRYYWKDRRTDSDTFGNTCNGFASRTFTLSQGQVVAMTGDHR
ncbi:MAG TPA: hypothetical protein VHL31_00210 [Geminicoccus sp.]|jgi:hypothetical protein|uniref:hypothetical protein n=1 Tax=Geminicoccus sp. TaxID=2024832 RepID=UPI002E32EE6C|nr:hypothetical protein [Geminicoccus sp.]HEX2524715.1 hypothetical protein [Geminicoccus sp.]